MFDVGGVARPQSNHPTGAWNYGAASEDVLMRHPSPFPCRDARRMLGGVRLTVGRRMGYTLLVACYKGVAGACPRRSSKRGCWLANRNGALTTEGISVSRAVEDFWNDDEQMP